MSLLSEEEIRKVFDDMQSASATAPWFIRYARAIESAILAKLASAELPEPLKTFEYPKGKCQDLYSADQLRQAHAQGFAAGASAQLSAEPFTHYRHYDEQVQPFADGNTVPLYTRREA